jgi:hypothetical protein
LLREKRRDEGQGVPELRATVSLTILTSGKFRNYPYVWVTELREIIRDLEWVQDFIRT